jgi:hypothetical protein
MGSAVSTGAVLIVNVTGTEYGLLLAPEEASTTCPEYTPGTNPAGFTDTAI